MAGPARPPLPSRAVPLLAGLAGLFLAGIALGLLVARPGPAGESGPGPRAAVALLALAALAGLVALARLRRLALAAQAADPTRDTLTGLPTHAAFRDGLEEALALARQAGTKVGVLVLDLRHFHELNDAHGRAKGDVALRLVATRLRNAVRRDDLVARVAGDRFAVLQGTVLGPEGALRLAERLAAALAEPLPLDGAAPCVSADIGIAVAPEDGAEASLLLTRAEEALAAARTAPEASMQCFSPGQDATLRRRRQLERELREAIAQGDFTLHWQPQRRLADGALTGFEALLRWNHPERGLVPPDEFIPLAEATGLIVPLGAWVLRAATAEAANWPGALKVAVNLSVVQIRTEGLLATVTEALVRSGLPPHRLELEVTESVLMQEGEHSARVLAGLQSLGVSVALDDFGTGWSSLAYLRRFPFDEIKMDRGFLSNLEADPKVEAVVTAILGLGRGLGIRVVAEGIETQEQAQRLLALGCERGQGWLLGRPMPADQARGLIAAEAGTDARSAA